MVNDYIVFIHENEIKSILDQNYLTPSLSNKLFELNRSEDKIASMFQFIQSAINITHNFPSVRNTLFVEKNIKEITALMLAEIVAKVLKLKALISYDTGKMFVYKAKEFIDAECENIFTVQEIASKLNTSVRSLQIAFKKNSAFTPIQFLGDRKLQKAHNILLSNNNPFCTVKEVAFKVGIFDLSRFSKTYFETFGELPSTTLKRTV